MGLSDTPSASRLHIGIFGKRNSGKSTLINKLTSQDIAIVSPVAGTTTDPVYKSMEILPLGPVMLIDTPGLDDCGALGEKRIKKTLDIIKKCDMAIVLCVAKDGVTPLESDIEDQLKKRGVPYITVFNKSDECTEFKDGRLYINASEGKNTDKVLEALASLKPAPEKPLLSGTVNEGDTVILVMPMDEAAPKGRIILPQQQVLREILDLKAQALCTVPQNLPETLNSLKKAPDLVITDSQAFSEVSAALPEDIRLTSFSILYAKKKADFDACIAGAEKLGKLKSSDKILISEGCTHKRQCNDIGTVKLPNMIRKYTGENPVFQFTSGTGFPENLSDFSLIIHCGACMLRDNEVKARFAAAKEAGVPITNYGIAIAKITGILDRCEY